tara:strand:+ start:186 stop:668 length:483 start_codon:yes stop_codon:yes gene_type:complete
MKGHTFIKAHFCNDERTLVETLWEKDGKNVVQYIEANDDSKAWKTLLTHTDIDALHEATYKHIKEQNVALEDTIVKIAKERGLLYDIDSVNSQMYKAIVSAIFTPFDAEKDKERLFMFKLELFEFEKIRMSKNKALKAKLRKTKNMIEALKVAIKIVEES